MISRSGGKTINFDASTTRSTSSTVISLLSLEIGITPRLLSEEMCSPVTPTATVLI